MLYGDTFGGHVLVLLGVGALRVKHGGDCQLIPHVTEDAGLYEYEKDHGNDAVDCKPDEDQSDTTRPDSQWITNELKTVV